MFADQFSRVIETMRATANTIPFVAFENCGQPLFTDTSVPHHYGPT